MAPQEHIPVAANVLGTIGTVLWSIQLIPQVYFNWKLKKTDGLPGAMMFLWAVCAVPFGVYAIVQNFNIPLQIQPHIFCCLSLVSWAQILFYNNGWRVWTGSLLVGSMAVFFAGLEVLLVLTLRGPYEHGNNAGMLTMGILASVTLAIGLLPPYWEAWKRNGRIIGFNWIFLSVDFSGAFFSLMALVAQQTFDVLGGILYIICLILEGGIFVSHVLWRIRTRKLRKKAKAAGVNFDDMPEAAKYQCDTDRIARNRLNEAEAATRQPSHPMVQTPTIHGAAMAANNADTVHEPNGTFTNEKTIATSINDRPSPFPSSNAPTEVGHSDEDDTADLESGHRLDNRKPLTVDTTPEKPQKPVTFFNRAPEDPTSAAVDSFQTANEENASPLPPNDEELEHGRRRGFRHTWVLVQSPGERHAHELRSPASVGQDLRSPASKISLKSPASKPSLRSPASVGQVLRGAVSLSSTRNAMGIRKGKPSEPKRPEDVEQGGEKEEELPPLPTPTTPAWMKEVEAQSLSTPGAGEKHSNDGEYQPAMHVAPQPMNDLPSPTTTCSVATSEDVHSPRIPLAQSDDVVPGTFDSVTPTQQQQQQPNSEG